MKARQFTITYEDGTVDEGESRQFDDVKVERFFGKPLVRIMQDARPEDPDDDPTVPLEVMWVYAYCAAKRVNPEHPEFDEWAEKVADISVELPDDEDVPDPLDRTP